jgi:hypothetical protein
MSAIVPSNISIPVTPADSHPDTSNYAQKGDLVCWNPVTNKWTTIPAATDTQRLTADSTQPLGIKWA